MTTLLGRTSTTTTAGGRERRPVIITDLDEPDVSPRQATTHQDTRHTENVTNGRQGGKLVHRRRAAAGQPKVINTMSGNFSRRSRSADCHLELRQEAAGRAEKGGATSGRTDKAQGGYFNDLLLAKERQMEKLLQRLATLHRFNDQFAEENQQLRSEVETLERRLADCEQCRSFAQQLSEAVVKCRTYESDLEMTQTLIYRLNVQIERYQDDLRRLRGEQREEATTAAGEAAGGDAGRTLPQHFQGLASAGPCGTQWLGTGLNRNSGEGGLHRHTLAPLLQAYDEMLRDKEQLIQQYGEQFERFTGELKRTLEENDRLLQQHETQRREMGGWREERTRLHAQLDVCRSKAEAQTRKCDLAKEQLVEVMRCYEQKTQTLLLDLEHLQGAYTRCKAEYAALRSASAQPQDVIASSLQECKELLEELRQQHSKEKHSLERNIMELTEREAANGRRVEQLQTENVKLSKDLQRQSSGSEELQRRAVSLQRAVEKVKRSRDRLKARLRIALQWAQKLEEGQASVQGTWDALKRLETVVRHKESQVRGLHARHLEEIGNMQRKLSQKEDTIRSILKGKLNAAAVGVDRGGGEAHRPR